MHLTAQLLAAALAAVPLASSAPVTQANSRRQLIDVLETAGDLIGPPLYDLTDELVNPTLNLIDDTVDDTIGDIFTRSEKSSSSSPKRRRKVLLDGLLEPVNKDLIDPIVNDIMNGAVYSGNSVIDVATGTISSAGKAAGDVVQGGLDYLVPRGEAVGSNGNKNEPRQWEWLPPDRYTEENVGRLIDAVDPTLDGVGDTLSDLGDYVGDLIPRGVERNGNKNKPRQWEWLPPDDYIDPEDLIFDDIVDPVTDGVGGAVGGVGDYLQDLFPRSAESNTKNKPRQWEWLPPDNYIDPEDLIFDDIVDPVTNGVGGAVGGVGDYLQDLFPRQTEQKRGDDKKWIVVKVKKAEQ